jgi:N-acetylmuramoyl-L-alanine amidase
MTKIISGKNVLMSIVVLLLTMMTFNQTVREEVIRAELKVAKFVDPKQIICMATNIFYEAGGESNAGKAAVARVTLNRVNSGFANTPCKVVYQATVRDDRKLCQFSWVCEEGKGNPNKNSQSYQASLQVAYEVLVLDKYKDVVPKNTLFFHNTSVEPDWEHYEKVQVIGNHIFYSKKKKAKKTHDRRRHARAESELQPGS